MSLRPAQSHVNHKRLNLSVLTVASRFILSLAHRAVATNLNPMQIRDAIEPDFAQITNIYNEIVLHSTATYNDRQGIGAGLLAELTVRAQALRKHSLIAAVDSRNSASLRFLKRHGFQRVGYLPKVGFEFDRSLDLALLQSMLAPENR
jgi:L-amino acid N-acyltransferase YncA